MLARDFCSLWASRQADPERWLRYGPIKGASRFVSIRVVPRTEPALSRMVAEATVAQEQMCEMPKVITIPVTFEAWSCSMRSD